MAEENFTEQIVNRNGIYKSAFPAYKVFIYGEEVSSDVIEVRVNQAGGSVERSAGTCSFVLVSPGDKYTLNFKNMQKISTAGKLAEKLSAAEIQDFMDTFNETTSLMNQSMELAEELELDPDAYVDQSKANEYKERLEELKQEYTEAQKSFEVDIASSFNWESISGFVKRRVLSRKLKYTVETNASVSDTNVLSYDEKVVPHYPFRVGDCIFHPNDPIRVAFRDPYDPRIWYWMFSGFMDTFTENSGPNRESLVTISATDISKTLRYAFIQKSTGFLDEEQEDIDNIGYLPQELFAGFTIFEILETLFFGTEFASGHLKKESIEAAVAGMTKEARYEYLVSVDPYAVWDEGDNPDPNSISKNPNPYFNEVVNLKIEERLNKLQGKKLNPIVHPRNVNFKKKSESTGVSAYFYGEVDEFDLNLGERIVSFKNWNDIIYHQVRREDLQDMASDNIVAPSFDSNLSIEQIIDTIGMGSVTDDDNGAIETVAPFPVGAGRVFYFAPGRLNSDLGRSVVDKSLVNISSLHSQYRDKLSYLYDVTERMDFRLYATPRGDLVFEIPMYDFDVQTFTSDYEYQIDTYYEDVSDFYESYYNLFGKSYDGDYTEEEANEMGKMLFSIEMAAADLESYDYGSVPEPDYGKIFTIEDHETISFSNTISDQGVITAYRMFKNISKDQAAMNNTELTNSIMAHVPELMPTLGFRIEEGSTAGYIETAEATEVFCAITLNRHNAESHNMSLSTLPQFGLMVNRPIYWRYRSYQANIVSLQHSIVWNSNCDTTINLNQIRAWNGEYTDKGRPKFMHFGGDRPFNLAELMIQGAATNDNSNQGD